ncbi:glycosyltransferase [Serinibacter arcticus]|uniref:glycosyltransferase n=1 Tax=Serinibacter arcticus TaxID=1655435 RepID=UPI0011B1F324|nr:glycosyltransferase [Serinibacter arcticus]
MREPRSVLTVLVTRGVTPWLSATLRALGAQESTPDRILVAVWDPTAIVAVRDALAEAGLDQADVVATGGAATFGAAVRTAIRDHPAVVGQWLWLLHDDSAPEPGALSALLRTVEQGSSIVVAGSKQVEWAAPDELISVGVGLTRSGRRFTALEESEIDQGQYDDRSDVLAVGTAGMLVRRDVWDELRGPDPALGPYGDGADLARRARLAGHRAVVVPRSVVRHARASYTGQRHPEHGEPAALDAPVEPVRSWSARRRAVLHSRLAGATTAGSVLLLLGMFVLAPVRALARVATKEFALIGPELRTPFATAAHLAAVSRARANARRTAVVPRRVLAPLQVGPGAQLAAWRDTRLQRASLRRSSRARSELEKAEAASLARRRRLALLGVTVLTVVVALVTVGHWALGDALLGGALLPVDTGVRDLWTLATSPWLAVGDGHAALPQPLLAVLAFLTTVLGGFWGTPVSATIAVLTVGAIPLAALGAWFAAGAATRGLAARAWAAVVWALAPTLLISLAQGRLGSIVAHLALPWVALGVARALGVQRRDVVLGGMVGARRVHAEVPDDDGPTTRKAPVPPASAARARGSIGAAAAAGLAFAVACAGAPLLLPLGLVAVVVMLLTLPRVTTGVQAGRGRLVLVVLPAIALVGPWLTAPFGTAGTGTQESSLDSVVRLLLSEPGRPLPQDVPDAWQQLLLWPGDLAPLPPALDVLGAVGPFLLTGPVLLGAVLALLRGGARGRTVRIAWAVGALALAGAVLVTHVPVGVALDTATGAETAVPAWSGPAVSLLLLALLVAAVVAADGLQVRLGENTFGWRQPVTAVVAAVLVIAPLASAVVWTWSVRTDPALLAVQVREDAPVPALGRQVQSSAASARVLSLAPTTTGYDVQVWRGAGPQLLDTATAPHALVGALLDPSVAPPDAADEALAVTVARLTVAADEAAPALVEHGVAVVVVPPVDSVVRPGVDATARAELVASLDGTAGLERVTSNAAGTIWRVVTDTGVARARVLESDASTPSAEVVVTGRDLPVGGLTSGLVRAGGEVLPSEQDRLVVLAERAHPGWRATLDGRRLEHTDLDWRQAFTLPAGAEGRLTLTYVDPLRTVWTVGQIVVLGLAGLLALPTRRRTPGEDA